MSRALRLLCQQYSIAIWWLVCCFSSETRSVFCHDLLSNRLLLLGTVVAQLVHFSAMYISWLSDVLNIQSASLQLWAQWLVLALVVLIMMELHKIIPRYFSKNVNSSCPEL
ncbi:MAG: hypothetical protein GXP21_02835 [Gammaproteobacteria bacterium]|nr:hypothetical protein [Gammaproteobacteria bacterium]